MHKYILTVLAAIVCNIVSSGDATAEWRLISKGESPSAAVYADPSDISIKDGMVKIWIMFDYETSQNLGDLSFVEQHEYDCKGEHSRVIVAYFYSQNMGKGELVFSESDHGQWEPVPQGTLSQSLWRFACKRR